MKSSLDMFIAATILVLALVFSGVFYANKRTVTKPPAPAQPTLTAVTMPNLPPDMGPDLGFGGAQQSGGGTSMAGGARGSGATGGAKGGGPGGPGGGGRDNGGHM